MIAKGNVLIGLDTRFGADWPGQRCRAKTRRGTACQRPANKENGRCRLHGGQSTGPKTAEGRAKIAAANTTTGQHTKAIIARRRKDAKIAKGLRDRHLILIQEKKPQRNKILTPGKAAKGKTPSAFYAHTEGLLEVTTKVLRGLTSRSH